MRARLQAPPFRQRAAVTGCCCPKESRAMSDVTPQFFTTSDGLRLAYRDQGQGIPLLCLAGLTRNMEDFEPALPVLLPRCRVIRLDSRGRGASDYTDDFATYSVAQEAADALALMDHLSIERFAILGTSRGGLIAMVLAAIVKPRLLGVMLNDIGPVIDADGLSRIMDYLGKRPKFATLEAAAEGMAAIYAASFPGVDAKEWRPHVARWWYQAADGLGLRYDPRLRDAADLQAKSGPTPDLWPLFDAMEGLPVALLRGQFSDLLTAETMGEMALRHPGMIATTVANRAHVPFLDEPESVVAMDAFLTAIGAP